MAAEIYAGKETAGRCRSTMSTKARSTAHLQQHDAMYASIADGTDDS